MEVLEQEAEDRRHRLHQPAAPGVQALPVGQDLGDLRAQPSIPWRCGSNWIIWPRAASSRRQRAGPSHCPAPARRHALCALGHRLVEAGHSVLFAAAYRLVQELLAAKRDLDIASATAQAGSTPTSCSRYDLGDLPQAPNRLRSFTLIAERYEPR